MPAAVLALALAAAPAREMLGQFGRWGAFREGGICVALAEPVARRDDTARPYAAITTWPGRTRNQFHLRLSVEPAGAPALTVGGQPFALLVLGRDAWARDAREDRRIVAAIRGSRLLRVAGRSMRGHRFTDDYPLGGAPSAIDAAAVGCLP